jgi:hypothetical protein
MKSRRELWIGILIVFLLLLLICVSSTVVIVRREGIDGLFRRKRAVVERVAPQALPIQDSVEKEVKDRLRDGTPPMKPTND